MERKSAGLVAEKVGHNQWAINWLATRSSLKNIKHNSLTSLCNSNTR